MLDTLPEEILLRIVQFLLVDAAAATADNDNNDNNSASTDHTGSSSRNNSRRSVVTVTQPPPKRRRGHRQDPLRRRRRRQYHQPGCILSLLPCVSRAWSSLFDSHQQRLWCGLFEFYGLAIPPIVVAGDSTSTTARTRTRTRMATRSGSNIKRSFFQRRYAKHQAYRHEADVLILDLKQRLQKKDCVSWVRKRLATPTSSSSSSSSSSMVPPKKEEDGASRDGEYYYFSKRNTIHNRVHHQLPEEYENRTVLLLAAWYGRCRTVHMFVHEPVFQASIYVVDGMNASPLLVAAWAGHVRIVKIILDKLYTDGSHEDNNNEDGDTNNANNNEFLKFSKTSSSNNKNLKNDDAIKSKQQQLLLRCRRRPRPRLLRQHQDYLDLKGIPPMTSSCGGRGPKTALDWAERKGFGRIVALLLESGATTTR